MGYKLNKLGKLPAKDCSLNLFFFQLSFFQFMLEQVNRYTELIQA